MYTIGLYTIVEVIFTGLHIKRKGPRGLAQQSRRYSPLIQNRTLVFHCLEAHFRRLTHMPILFFTVIRICAGKLKDAPTLHS